MQINRLAALVQIVAVRLAQHDTAASRQHANAVLRQFTDHYLLKIAKCCLTLSLEKLADRAANPALYDEVRVEKPPFKPPGQLAANR